MDVGGQENVKHALEVAAAGGHNIIMVVYLNVFNNNLGLYFRK